jgi:DnaK suppressor protein
LCRGYVRLKYRYNDKKGRIVMTNKEKVEIKEKIELELKHLVEQIETLEVLVEPISPDCSLGRLTRSEAMHEQQITLRILDESRLKETRLLNALQRIDDEMFGICIECDELIGLGRMLVRPESIRCVECAP